MKMKLGFLRRMEGAWMNAMCGVKLIDMKSLGFDVDVAFG